MGIVMGRGEYTWTHEKRGFKPNKLMLAQLFVAYCKNVYEIMNGKTDEKCLQTTYI